MTVHQAIICDNAFCNRRWLDGHGDMYLSAREEMAVEFGWLVFPEPVLIAAIRNDIRIKYLCPHHRIDLARYMLDSK